MAVPTVAMRLNKKECELMYKALWFWLEDLSKPAHKDEDTTDLQKLHDRAKYEHDKFWPWEYGC